jgi:hypothetical protein
MFNHYPMQEMGEQAPLSTFIAPVAGEPLPTSRFAAPKED